MRNVMWVGLGGFLGSILRYGLGSWIHRGRNGALFPAETLAVNVIGCLVVGVLAGLALRAPFGAGMRAFLFVGVLGGFTTFSAFGWETFQLLRDGRWPLAALSVALQIGLGVVAVWAGMSIAGAAHGGS